MENTAVELVAGHSSSLFQQSKEIVLEENHDTKNLESYAEIVSTAGDRLVVPDCIGVSEETRLASVDLGCILAALRKSLYRPSYQPLPRYYSLRKQQTRAFRIWTYSCLVDTRPVIVFLPSLALENVLSMPWDLAVLHVAMVDEIGLAVRNDQYQEIVGLREEIDCSSYPCPGPWISRKKISRVLWVIGLDFSEVIRYALKYFLSASPNFVEMPRVYRDLGYGNGHAC